MKRLFLILTVVSSLLVLSCNNSKKSNEAAELQTYTFSVEGMTCTGCEQTVQAEVNKLEGIDGVTASHKEKTAIVTFDILKTDTVAVKEAINASGYTVKGIIK